MKYPRFRVATCEGYAYAGNLPGRPGGHTVLGLSATVCDTLHLWAEVVTYRSEDRVTGEGANAVRGREGALRAAEEHAARLNEIHRLMLHKERVRAARAWEHDRG